LTGDARGVPQPNPIVRGIVVAVTDIEAGALVPAEARAEALLTMARRETGRRDSLCLCLSLVEAEQWWAAQRDEMGLPSLSLSA
jgi:hypothetical protein